MRATFYPYLLMALYLSIFGCKEEREASWWEDPKYIEMIRYFPLRYAERLEQEEQIKQRYLDMLQAVEEPNLQTQKEYYRIFWFAGWFPYEWMLRIEKEADSLNVVYKFKQFNRRDSTSQLFTLFEQKIPHTFADNLTSYLDKMDFFNAEKSTGEIMVDGDFFLIEGSSSHRYHIIERYHIEDKGLDSVLISLFYNANLIAESLGTDSVLSHVAKDRFKRLP